MEEFADGAAQSDDQTILVLTYVHDAVSPEESPEAEGSWFCLAAVKGELPKVNAEIDRVLATVREMQPEVAPLRLVTSIGDEMKLAVHEAVANLIEHGGLGVDDEIGIRLCAGAEGIVAEIDSGGPPFDPAAVDPAPPEPEALLEGGYGLHLIHALTDSIEYEPGEDRHRLRLTRAWRAS